MMNGEARRWLLALGFAAAAGGGAGRAAAEPIAAGVNQAERYFFDQIGPETSLPPSNVGAVLQTRDGYLWVGTEGGIARFDGLRFENFRAAKTPAFRSGAVLCLLEDPDGGLWIGTDQGLLRYRQGGFELMGLPEATVRMLAQDRSGRVWIATDRQGLYSWFDGKFQHYDAAAALPAEMILCLYTDSSDRLWIGYDRLKGAVCCDHGVFRRFDGDGRLGAGIRSICEAPKGTLWFGTRSSGLYRLRGGAVSFFGPESGLAPKTVTDLEPASDGGMWVAAGVLQKVVDLDHFAIRTILGAPTDNIRTMREDREGGLWLRTDDAGLIRAQKLPFPLIGGRDGMPVSGTKTVSLDPAGNFWLAVQNVGVTRIAPDGAVDVFSGRETFPGVDPYLVFAARDGSVWVSAGGTRVWRNGVVTPVPGIPLARSIYEDRQGAIWLGTEARGVFLFRDGRLSKLAAAGGRAIPYAISFSEGPDGTMFAGTWNDGVFAVKDGRVTSFGRGQGLPNDHVRAVFADAQGCVWVGMRSSGLAVLQEGQCFSSDALSAAVADHVSAIADDDCGHLWLGTPAGILWTVKADLLDALRHGRSLPPIHVVRSVDGRHTAAAWNGNQPAVWKTPDHRMLFATRWGVLVVDPQHLPINTAPPPVHIGKITIDRQVMDPRRELVVPADAREMTIEYTAVSFVQPGGIVFEYRLDGYDRDWVDAGSRRVATYTHLPAGRYVFRVKARNSDGVWNEVGDQVAVRQRPHFYQTGWFFGLVAAALAGCGWAINRWSHRRLRLRLERLEQRQAMEKERRRIAKNLHDELGADLTEIGFFAERARGRATVPEVREDMRFLARRVRGLAESLDAVVWTVNPANDSLDRLTAYLCGLFQDLFRLSGIRCRLDVSREIPAHPLDPEERSDLFLAAKEAMNNVLKHSAATEVWLRARVDGEWFRLSIEDNGCGFDPADPAHARRNGLANMRSRLAETGGTFAVESSPGRGAAIRIAIPLVPRAASRPS